MMKWEKACAWEDLNFYTAKGESFTLEVNDLEGKFSAKVMILLGATLPYYSLIKETLDEAKQDARVALKERLLEIRTKVNEALVELEEGDE